MPNRMYEKGVRAERKVMKKLEGMGYTVMRTAGSHGPYDVIGIQFYNGIADVMLLQVKKTKKIRNIRKLNVHRGVVIEGITYEWGEIMPKQLSKDIKVEKLGEDKYKITILEVQECNKKHLEAVYKENLMAKEDFEDKIGQINDFINNNKKVLEEFNDSETG